MTTTASERKITVENVCDYTVWPGIYNSDSTVSLNTTGFDLKKGESRVIDAPKSWEGRFWCKSLCSTNSVRSPATLVDFSFNKYNGQDLYDVSLVEGYNLPLVVVPVGLRSCNSTGCVLNLNKTCPSELKVGREHQPVGCMSDCQNQKPFKYYTRRKITCVSKSDEIFKRECPLANVDGDATRLFTCSNPHGYVITFCPSTIPYTTR